MEMTQALTFLDGEGDEWLKRNREILDPDNDTVLWTLDGLCGITKGNCLEIGCSNGIRLKELNRKYGWKVYGVDPSREAIKEAKENGIIAKRGTARLLPWDNNFFDVVIYGFCLYLCDRESLFEIVTEGDRVLKDGGIMVIYDFNTNYPCKNPYKHKDGIWSYKYDYAKLFMGNPAYKLVGDHTNRCGSPQTKVSILRKNIERGWPLCGSVY